MTGAHVDQSMPDPEQSRIGIVDSEVDDEASNHELLQAAEELVLPPEPDPGPGASPTPRVRKLGPRAVALALTQKGLREEGGGGNRNPYSRYFGYGAQHWCADFVSWAVDRCGNQDRAVPWGYPSGVAAINAWASREERFKSSPRRGDVFTYKNNKHTGLIVSVSGDRFTTIEGNTDGPDGKTIWVWGHVRANDGTYYFVRRPDA